jgi:folylpolyglutamate synthase/dihydropteroate synthase
MVRTYVAAVRPGEVGSEAEKVAVQAVQRTRPPCRLEGVRVRAVTAGRSADVAVVLDAAHNPDALQTMLAALRRRVAVDAAVVALSSDRDPHLMAVELLRGSGLSASRVFACESDSTRAMPATRLADALAAVDGVDAADVPQFGRPWVEEQFREAPEKVRRSETFADDAAEPDSHKLHLIDPASGIGRRYVGVSAHQSSSVKNAMLAAISAVLANGKHSATDLSTVGAWDPVRDAVADMPVVLVTGSVYMMREAKEVLGIQQIVDDVVK